MKPFASFAIAGLFTLVGFSIPPLEEAAFLYAWIGFGPSLLFVAVLLFLTHRFLSKKRMAAAIGASLFAYWLGEVFYVQLQFRWHLGPSISYISPAVGAFTLLACLSVIRWRRRIWRRPLFLGTLLSLVSALPLWVSKSIPGSGYFWWGAHIFCWYSLVGPCAVRILIAPDDLDLEKLNTASSISQQANPGAARFADETLLPGG